MDYSGYSIRQLLIVYGSVLQSMRDYERDGGTFTVRYESLCEKEKEIMAEAERRDDKPEGLDK